SRVSAKPFSQKPTCRFPWLNLPSPCVETRMDLLLSIVIGFSLAAAAGFRVFVPLLVMSLAARAGQLELASGLDWIATDAALGVFAVATAVEVAGYCIPWIDNLLDTV